MKKYQYVFEASRCTQKQNQASSNASEHPEQHIKSTTSTRQPTYHRASTENLYIHKLQSLILDLQRQADQQQFQMHSLSEQSSIYMKSCEQQKQVIASMNIQALKNQYQEQITEMTHQRQKIQEIINQLRADYEQAFKNQEKQLNNIKTQNQSICQLVNSQLDKKKNLLGLIAEKNEKIEQLQEQLGEAEEDIDELRNIERKFNIAMKEIEELQRGLRM